MRIDNERIKELKNEWPVEGAEMILCDYPESLFELHCLH